MVREDEHFSSNSAACSTPRHHERPPTSLTPNSEGAKAISLKLPLASTSVARWVRLSLKPSWVEGWVSAVEA